MAKVIFLHLFVILFTGGRGVSSRENPPARENPPSARENPPCQGEPPLPGRTPPGPDPPLDQADPPNQAEPPLGPDPPDQTPPRPGRPPQTRQTPLDQADPQPPGPGRPPPPEADSSIRSTSGRYASYWNAFLLTIELVQVSQYVQNSLVLVLPHPFVISLLFLSRL